VVALRPDITPQIARLIATRYRDEAGPVRLCYEGTVLRLDRRARSQRELIQAGVELAGVGSPEGDAEVIALGAAALAAAGLPRPTIDLGHLGLAREVLAALGLPPEGARRGARPHRQARSRGPRRGLARGARRARRRRVRGLCPSSRGRPRSSPWRAAARPRPASAPPSTTSPPSCAPSRGRELAARLHVDLGEVRGFDYYTGVRLQGFVDGAPEPVLQGGRYDSLLGRYGRPCPAVGFAVDVEATAGALEAAQAPEAPMPEDQDRGRAVLVSGPIAEALPLAARLRAEGRRVAIDYGALAGAALDAYARRWEFSEVVRVGRGQRSAPRPRQPKANGKKRSRG
jgi:ATP phosphoribosyltransferase regulatory subunit